MVAAGSLGGQGVKGEMNPADLMTKFLSREEIEARLSGFNVASI